MKQPRIEELPPAPAGKSGWPWTAEDSPPLPPVPPGGWPRITVVMPSFQQAEFLEEALRSVLLQGYPNLEFFVYDGGSADGSVEIIQRYAAWIDFWVSEKDGGQSNAINQGFARAGGEIWAWLNSDDAYAPGALAQVGTLLAGRKMTMLVGASVITEGAESLAGPIDARYPSWPAMLYEARTFPQPSTFWTRDLASAAKLPGGLLDEDLYFVMDYDLWLRLRINALATLFVRDILSYERTHAAQKTLNHDERFDRERARAIIRATRLTGEGPRRWLLKSRARRIWNGCRIGRLHHCRASSLQGAVRGAMRRSGKN